MAQGNNQLQVNVVANVRAAQAAINKLAAKPVNLTINPKGFSQPLGKIQGQLGEFEKSLEASNARVIAFGASASAIYAVQKAFSESVKSAIEVEKALKDINVILNLTDQSLSQFGTSLFDIAKNTGNTFSAVAIAATELSRQGLGVNETLKRTQDALILTRLSGLGAAESVEAITATLNGFQKAALSSTDVINKLAAVDANFAVSSGDLAEAIKRVGSSAEDAGVSFDELLAIVTSAQQITARGGSVIGNSFKTIFTRLQRPKVLEDLQQLGIETQTAEGNTKPLIQILSDLAKTFDVLNDSQRAAIAEQVGGVFQINILKAALGDLNKEYSVFSNALKTSTGATDEAIRRNEALNTTLASLINKTLANLTAAGAKIGELSLAPALKKVFGGLNTVLESFGSGDSEDFGSKIGEGLLKGIGNFLSGPGIIIATKALFSIFERLTVFSADAVKTLLGLNVQATQQAQIQQQINTLLSQNPSIIAQIVSGQTTLQDIQDNILNTIKAQTLAMEQQVTLSKALATSLSAAGVSIGASGATKGRLQAKAGGYMPNAFKQEEASAMNLGAVNPKAQFSKGTIGGKKFIKNNKEIEIPNFGKNGDSAVIPMYGSVGDKRQKELYDKLKFLGFVPNFAQLEDIELKGYQKKVGVLLGTGGSGLVDYTEPASQIPALKGQPEFKGKRIVLKGIPTKGAFPLPEEGIQGAEKQFDSVLSPLLRDGLQSFSEAVGKTILGRNPQQKPKGGDVYSALQQGTKGDIFESAVRGALTEGNLAGGAGQGAFDFNPKSPAQKALVDFFGMGLGPDARIESKIGAQAAENIPSKVIRTFTNAYANLGITKETGKRSSKKPGFGAKPARFQNVSDGFIPNFSSVKDAMETEKKMGGSPALDFQEGVGLYVRDRNTQSNFSAVKRDHPEGINQAIENSRKAQENLARGFIPNFASTGSSNIASNSSNAGMDVLKKVFSDKELPKGIQKFKQNIFLTSFAFSTLQGLVESFNKDGKSAFGNILSGVSQGASTFTSLAGVIPGQVGLIVGAVAGLTQAIDSVATSFLNADIEEIIKQSAQTSEDFSKLSDASQKYAVSFQKLQEIYKSNSSYKEVDKAERDLYESLQNIPQEFRNLFASARTLTEVQDSISKSLSEKGKEKEGGELAKFLGQSVIQNRGSPVGRLLNFGSAGGAEKNAIYSGKKGMSLATETAGQITNKLSSKFLDDFENGLIDTTQSGYNFIKMLKQYGIDAQSASILTGILDDSLQDGEGTTKLLANALYEESAARVQATKKYKQGQKTREEAQAIEAEEVKIKRRLTAETENAAAISEMYSNALHRTALQEKKLIDIRRSSQSEIIAEASRSRLQTAQPFLSETSMARGQYQNEAFQRKSNFQTKQSDIMSSAIEQISTNLSESIQGEINKLRSENAPNSKIQKLQNRKGEIANIVRQGESPAQISQALEQLGQELALDDQAILAQKANEILANIQNDQQNALVEYQKGNNIAQEQLRNQLIQIQDQQKLKVAGGVQGFLDPNSFQTTFDNFTKNLNLYREEGSRSVIERGRGATGLLSNTLDFAGGGLPIGTGGGLGSLRSEAIAGRAADIRNQSRALGAKAPIGLRPVFRDISANASEIAAKQIDNLIKDQNIGDNVDKIATTLQQIQTSLTPNLGPTNNATQSFVNQRNSAATNVASALQPLKGSVDLNIPNNLLALNVNGKISVEGGNVEVTLSPDSDLTALVTPIINNFMNTAKQDIKNEFNNRILKLREEAGLRREATAV